MRVVRFDRTLNLVYNAGSAVDYKGTAWETLES
jgi:hypothetical protein